MKLETLFVASLVTLAGTSGLALAAGDGSDGQPLIGEVRSLAVAPSNKGAVAILHHAGWLEADGQLLSARTFPELFGTLGRTWTANGVQEGRFAIPVIRDRSRGTSADNRFGVLGPGDLVTGGRVNKPWARQAPLTYWIYVGHDVSELENAASKRQ